MKIRKALEKADQERPRDPAQRLPETVEQAAGQAADWQAPTYSQSAKVQLDPAHLQANRCVCLDSESPILEAYKVLRERLLQQGKGKEGRAIMVTSPRQGEGKTITAINLAITYAKQFNQTALLVDCDLKKQDIHRYLGYSGHHSLVDYVNGRVEMKELITWPEIEKLTVISGDSTVFDSVELLGSPKMESLVEEMKNRYADRSVILDVPAVLDSADALTFAPLVDSIVLVVEKGSTTQNDINSALERLPKEKIAGFILNEKNG